MSAKTVYAPGHHLSYWTREAIEDLGIDLDDYAANIERKLRARGEDRLADAMLAEIEAVLSGEAYR